MSAKQTQPLRGFRDRYPEDKALQEYIFSAVRSVGALYGFKEYDGPLVEPLSLYEGKTSREILQDQAFVLEDKKGTSLMLRPEMTPTLARMVAAKASELVLPARLFNIGLRYRYETPQKGRDREFYQMDFDILGASSILSDIECVSVAVSLLRKLGAGADAFKIFINSRSVMNDALRQIGVEDQQLPSTMSAIDKVDKLSSDDFKQLLSDGGLSEKAIGGVLELLDDPNSYAENFNEMLMLAEDYGIREYVEVNPAIVRGLDYYTGFVFEAKSTGEMTRSILGGGRYDNLVGMFGRDAIPGVGFATSDTVLREFLSDFNLLPDNPIRPVSVCVTVFSPDLRSQSIKAVRKLREEGISCELYPESDKLPRQFKYADRQGIPYVIVIGPDEAEKGMVVLKDLSTGEQKSMTLNDVVNFLGDRA